MSNHSPTVPAAPAPAPIPERPDRWDILRFILFFLLSLVICVVVLVAIAAATGNLPASRRMGDLTALQHGWVLIGIYVAFYVSLAGSVWLAINRRGRDAARTLAFKPVHWGILLLSGVGLIILSMLVSILAAHLLEDIQPQIVEMLGNMTFSPLMIVTGLLVIGVVAPVAEELLFRGLLFGWLRAHWPYWPTAIVTSALFGLLHGSLSYAVVAGTLGLMLAYLRERTGSLWTPIAAHIMNNLFAAGMAMLASSLA